MGMKGGVMESEIQASPTLASFPILPLTCSAGFTDGGAGPVPGTKLHSPRRCPRAQGLGKSPRHPYWDC